MDNEIKNAETSSSEVSSVTTGETSNYMDMNGEQESPDIFSEIDESFRSDALSSSVDENSSMPSEFGLIITNEIQHQSPFPVVEPGYNLPGSEPVLHRAVETENSTAIQRKQNFFFLAQFNGAFKYYIPVLVGVLQFCSHQLEIRPANLFTFIVATLVYYLALTVNTELNIPHATNNSQLFDVIAFNSGSLSSALLVSMLVPRLIGCIILFSWASLSILVVHQHTPLSNKENYKMLGQNIKDIKIYEKIKNIKIPKNVSSLWSKNKPGLPK